MLQKFAYDRYNVFVYGTDNNEKVQEKDLKNILPFVLENFLHFSKKELEDIRKVLKSEITKSRTAKSLFRFINVTEMSEIERFIHIALHYCSTYGMGLQGNEAYIPNPDFEKEINELIIIKTISKDEFVKRFLDDIYTTLQWKNDEILEIKEIIKELNLNESININNIPSKELRIVIASEFNLTIKDAEDFLRTLIYKATGKSLLIKSPEVIDALKSMYKEELYAYFKNYIKNYGYIGLAEIFHRYKPLFLACKKFGFEKQNKIINKISKLAKIHHKPKGLPEYLKITERIEKNNININEFFKIITELDTSYLIKLTNALLYRYQSQLENNTYEIYQIRNGKIFVKDREVEYKGDYEPFLNLAKSIIESRIIEKLLQQNIKINMDKYGNYALPTSGKQFIGNIPNGTIINDFNIVGIYWENIDDRSIDLDLSLTNTYEKLGWNGAYSNIDFIYSGDMTDAKNGAVECFYMKNKPENPYSLKVNFYNFLDKDIPVTLWAGKINSKNEIPTRNMVDNITFKTHFELNKDQIQKQLGIILEDKFYVGEFLLPFNNIATIDCDKKYKAIDLYLRSKLRFKDLKLTQGQNEIELDKDKLLELVS